MKIVWEIAWNFIQQSTDKIVLLVGVLFLLLSFSNVSYQAEKWSFALTRAPNWILLIIGCAMLVFFFWSNLSQRLGSEILDVQPDRRSNYERGAKLLYSVSPSDTVVVSFLEDSSMWNRPDDTEDKVFDKALTHAIKSSECTVQHVIRCDDSAHLPKIISYIKRYDDAQKYLVYIITNIDSNFPPLDILVLKGKAAQIEFPQTPDPPSYMGPSIVVKLPKAVHFVEAYAEILITKSICIKNANGLSSDNINRLEMDLQKSSSE